MVHATNGGCPDKSRHPIHRRPGPQADPQADLQTAILDIARLQRDGDIVKLWLRYTPPDKFDPHALKEIQETQQQVAQNPELQQKLQKSVY